MTPMASRAGSSRRASERRAPGAGNAAAAAFWRRTAVLLRTAVRYASFAARRPSTTRAESASEERLALGGELVGTSTPWSDRSQARVSEAGADSKPLHAFELGYLEYRPERSTTHTV